MAARSSSSPIRSGRRFRPSCSVSPACSSDQAQQLLAFLDAHLGEEIGCSTGKRRYWKGVITTPTEPVVQDGRDSFSASLEFEGELVPA